MFPICRSNVHQLVCLNLWKSSICWGPGIHTYNLIRSMEIQDIMSNHWMIDELWNSDIASNHNLRPFLFTIDLSILRFCRKYCFINFGKGPELVGRWSHLKHRGLLLHFYVFEIQRYILHLNTSLFWLLYTEIDIYKYV